MSGKELRALAEATPGKQLTALLGFSVGGFVVANFQDGGIMGMIALLQDV